MIALFMASTLAATTFIEQSIPHLEIGSRDVITGLSPVNTRPGDLNSDSATDLLTPNAVYLQRDGAYPPSGRVFLPEAFRDAPALLHEGHLLAFADSAMVALSFEGEVFREVRRIAIAPESDAAALMLHDVTGNGVEELFVITSDTVALFQSTPPFTPLGTLDIFPPKRPRLTPTIDLWRARSDLEQGDFEWIHDLSFVASPGGVVVIERVQPDPSRLYYALTQYAVEAGSDTVLAASETRRQTSRLVNSGTVPVVKPYGTRPDLLSITESGIEAIPFDEPLYDVAISSDFGETWSGIRLKAGTNQLAFVDTDADGDRDVIASHGSLFDAPVREVVSALISDRTLTVDVNVHLRRSDGTLTRRPRRVFQTTLDLGRPAVRRGARWENYLTGNLISATSDVNGDGRTDIVAWEMPNEIAVYINEEGVFPEEASVVLRVANQGGLYSADVDHDGRADIVILPQPTEGNPSPIPIVFFSRE